jgi:glycosyltransferase involved in cell wall biosynthesis
VDVLLRAFAAVSQEYPDYSLRIVGYLPEREQNRALFDGNPRIEFVGPLMPDAIIEQMRDCSVLVLPSRSEGMPRVLIEAMASGKPIIAARVGGIPHYITHGETGLLFDREDVETLAKLLREVLTDPDHGHELGMSGMHFANARLSDDRYVDAMARLIARVVAS